MNDILTIDGTLYTVNIVSLTETSEFLDSDQTHRTTDGDLYRKMIGIYFNYELQLGQIQNAVTAQTLWNKLHEFTPFHTLTLPHDASTQTFIAYVTGVSRPLKLRKNGVNYWGGYTVKFIAKAPQIS